MSCCLSYHDHSEQKSQFMSVMWLQFPHSTPVSWVRVKPVSVVWCPHPSPRHSRRLKRRVSATNPRNHLQLFSVSPGPAPGVTTLHTVSTISTISTHNIYTQYLVGVHRHPVIDSDACHLPTWSHVAVSRHHSCLYTHGEEGGWTARINLLWTFLMK